MALDLLVTLPHVFAVLMVVFWLLRVRRSGGPDPGAGEDGSGGGRSRRPMPQRPRLGAGGGRGDLARSA
jgi:hypothetical protein